MHQAADQFNSTEKLNGALSACSCEQKSCLILKELLQKL